VGDLLPLVGAGAVLVAAAGLIQSHRVVAADSSGPTNTNAWLCHKFCAQKCCICWVKSLLIIKKWSEICIFLCFAIIWSGESYTWNKRGISHHCIDHIQNFCAGIWRWIFSVPFYLSQIPNGMQMGWILTFEFQTQYLITSNVNMVTREI
jgi:hypothetical protein